MQIIGHVDGVAEAIRKGAGRQGLVESRFLVYSKHRKLLKHLEVIQSCTGYAPLVVVYPQSLEGGGTRPCSSTVLSECGVSFIREPVLLALPYHLSYQATS